MVQKSCTNLVSIVFIPLFRTGSIHPRWLLQGNWPHKMECIQENRIERCQGSLNGTHFCGGVIKLDANVAGNFEGFPMKVVHFWVVVTMTPDYCVCVFFFLNFDLRFGDNEPILTSIFF